MSALTDWLAAVPALVIFGVFAWIVATARRNVGLVDIAWSLFFLLAAAVYAMRAPAVALRGWIVIALVTLWALRLAGYLAARNWNAARIAAIAPSAHATNPASPGRVCTWSSAFRPSSRG